jgi:YidC/Oxa1 family membrane protein insertase
MVASAYRGVRLLQRRLPLQEVHLDEMKDADLNKTTQGGWVAMLQHYFVSAWAPNANDTNSFYSRVIPAPGHHRPQGAAG